MTGTYHSRQLRSTVHRDGAIQRLVAAAAAAAGAVTMVSSRALLTSSRSQSRGAERSRDFPYCVMRADYYVIIAGTGKFLCGAPDNMRLILLSSVYWLAISI